MSGRRLRPPPLALLSWAIAAVALAALAVAVARYLGGAHAMHMGAGDALSRAGGDPFGPLLGDALVSKWQLNALALAALVCAAAWYLTNLALLSVRSPGTRWPLARAASFLAGLLVCGYATNGAIAVYDQVLFTAHMAGHLALVMLAPALLMAGRPLRLMLAASPPARRARLERLLQGRVVSLLTAPPVALATYAVVIIASHLTGLMDTIMRNTWAGELEHLVYVLVGCQFFVLVVGDEPIRWRLSSPARLLLLGLSMAVDTFTGIVLMMGNHAIGMLPSPDVTVDALSDTRTGGAIMWFGGDGIMAAIMIAIVIGWLNRAGTDVADEHGWLEQARLASFTAHTGTEAADPAGLDQDDAARESYNAWLANLERRG
jgi:putative copper resistance protein D